MQTYTHAVIGLVLGKVLFPQDPYAHAICPLAAVAPDLVMVPQYMLDLIQGRVPMTKQSKSLRTIKEVSHSLPFWIIAVMLGHFLAKGSAYNLVLAFTVGGLSHVTVDVFTHKDLIYSSYDASFVWPLNKSPFNLSLFAIIAPWEYRRGFGVLVPKLGEFIILIALIITYILIWTLT